jgi:hypothetical protein
MIHVHGFGAVSPAGWGVPALYRAVMDRVTLPTQAVQRPGWEQPLCVLAVPPPSPVPTFFNHPRMRRASAISQYAAAAALEALGDSAQLFQTRPGTLGIIVCVMAGSVNYSRRFYEQVLQEPATASPLMFPETVFNAPASHLAALLGSNEISYTLVGDEGAFLQGLALAANWLLQRKVEACLVIGAEETDWIVADAMKLFDPRSVHGAGAGALLLKTASSGSLAELTAITDSFLYTQNQRAADAAKSMRTQLPACSRGELLCTGGDEPVELAAWQDWSGPRFTLEPTLGQAFVASSAWQCVAACQAVRTAGHPAANVSVVGANQQAIGARFNQATLHE